MSAKQSLLDRLRIDLPILQAPMAWASGSAMAIAVSNAGGLGSIPCAMLSPASVQSEIAEFRQHSSKPLNLNFFCHSSPATDHGRDTAWKQKLATYNAEFGLDSSIETPFVNRAPFGETMCDIVEDTQPEVVSFHFGLPASPLLDRVKSTGAYVIASATTVAEAAWLETNGCDAVIAQGFEAGGHRGMFLTQDISTQSGTLALVPQIVDALSVPVIAAGGISDGRGVAAALVLGAQAAQVGTAYLFTPQALISDLHRDALLSTPEGNSALTNLFTGRPARSLMNRLMRDNGPISALAPPFPTAGAALAQLKIAAEARGKTDFSSLWSGQASGLCNQTGAADLTRQLAENAKSHLNRLAGRN